MISVGIDVAKGKSTVCTLKPYGEIVSKPFDLSHVEKDLGELAAMLLRFDDEVKVDLCQYFGQKKSKDYAAVLSSSSSFC